MKIPHLHDDPRTEEICKEWIALVDEEITRLERKVEAGTAQQAVLNAYRQRRNRLRRWLGFRVEARNQERHKVKSLARLDVESDDVIRLLASVTRLAQSYIKLLHHDPDFALRPRDAALMHAVNRHLEARFGNEWPLWDWHPDRAEERHPDDAEVA